MKIVSIIILFLITFEAYGLNFTPTAGNIGNISAVFYLASISEIKDTKEAFEADFYLRLIWEDSSFKGRYKETKILPVSSVNVPQFGILNEKDLRRSMGDQIQVESNGILSTLIRFSGTLTHFGDYSNFPFDQQKFKIEIVFPNKEYKVNVDPKKFGVSETLSTYGWKYKNPRFLPDVFEGPKFSGVTFPMAVFEIEGKRELGFYLWKVFFPMFVIFMMSMGVYWFHPDETESRVNISVTSLLTVIAYWFVLNSSLPQISYFSKIDVFIVGSLSLVFMSYLSVAVTYIINKKDKDLAERVQLFFRIFHATGGLILIIYELAAV